MQTSETRRHWALLWHTTNLLDGDRSLFLNRTDSPGVLLFRTRQEARAYAWKQFGYIARRPDLKREPHGWRVPKAVRVSVTVRSES